MIQSSTLKVLQYSYIEEASDRRFGLSLTEISQWTFYSFSMFDTWLIRSSRFKEVTKDKFHLPSTFGSKD